MNTVMIKKLIWKDLSLATPLIAIFCACCVASIFIAIAGGEVAFYVGSVLLACTLIVSGIVAALGTVAERKQQLFLSTLSLPITYKDYVIAKLFSTLLFCGIPLLVAWFLSVFIIAMTESIANGMFVLVSIFAMEMMASYCVLLALILTKPTDIVVGFSIGAHNIFFNFFIFAMIRNEAIREAAGSTAIAWNGTAQIIFLLEVVIAVAAIVVVFFTQSNKKDFV